MIVKTRHKLIKVDFKKGKIKKTTELEQEHDVIEPGQWGADRDEVHSAPGPFFCNKCYGETSLPADVGGCLCPDKGDVRDKHEYCGECKACMDWLWTEFHTLFNKE
jgi:hypothetical protein